MAAQMLRSFVILLLRGYKVVISPFLGQHCRVSPEAYLDRSYEGLVAEIAPEASRQKGTLQIKVQVKNPDRFLTPELSAKVVFLDPKKQAAN